jgi:hypothetical protein
MLPRGIKFMEYEMGRDVTTTGEKRNACRILVRKPERKRSLGRKRLCKWIIVRWIMERKDRGYGPNSSG